MNKLLRICVFPPALLLAATVWTLGFRKRILRRNFQLMRWNHRAGLYWKICFNASRDLTELLMGLKPQTRVERRSNAALQAMRENPSLLLTAHFHNWEFLGSFLHRKRVPLLAAARTLRNPKAQKLLLQLRRRINVPTVSENVPRAALRHLQEEGCFALLWDQHSPDSEYQGRFFGLPVNMNPLPLFLLSHRPCPAYFGIILPNGRLRLVMLLKRFDGNWQQRLTQRYHRVLETLIRKHPGYWYGFLHARFKHSATYPGHRVRLSEKTTHETTFSYEMKS